MATTQVTRCPHCQTTFRIRLEQLAVAKGAVRCGSCLQVFKAIDHLVPATSNAALPKAPAQQKPASAAKAAPIQKPQARKPAPSQSAAAGSKTSKPATGKPAVKPAPAKPEINFDDIPDQIADDPLEDLGIRSSSTKDSTINIGLNLDDSVFSMQEDVKPSRYSLHDSKESLDFDLIDEFSDSATSSSSDSWADSLLEDEQDNKEATTDSDESWADALLDESSDQDVEVEEIDMSFAKANVAKEEDDYVAPLDDDFEEDTFHLTGDEESNTEVFEFAIDDPLDELHDDPLELDGTGHKSAISWAWFSAAIVMLIALATQVAYFKFNDWARSPSYRPAYQLACQVLQCQLPAVQDISKMATQHFVVRSHNKIEDALSVDTLLVNNAGYQQPFPDIRLIFTGLNEQIIASRSFRPTEYLSGELAGVDIMPSKTPIHIAIEIMDPGPEAVGYRIELASNQ